MPSWLNKRVENLLGGVAFYVCSLVADSVSSVMVPIGHVRRKGCPDLLSARLREWYHQIVSYDLFLIPPGLGLTVLGKRAIYLSSRNPTMVIRTNGSHLSRRTRGVSRAGYPCTK